MGNFHNNQLPNNHFRKDWQRRVKTWFNQPGRAARRHRNRVTRAATLGARPLKSLRPAVHCPTVRYNMKVREGYGFSLAEIKEAGFNKRECRGLGVVVDYRRRNLSEESKKLNVERLKEYKTRLIVFPKRTRTSVLLKKQGKIEEDKPKSGRFTLSDKPVSQLSSDEYTRQPVPLPVPAHESPRKITAEEKKFEAYKTLRDAWTARREAGKTAAAEKKED